MGVGCCAQFAVSRDAIRANDLAVYERWRNWLLETELSDAVSGRVLEYSWHILFGREAVHCPPAKGCYCETFGLCGEEMKCTEGACEGRYTLPPFSTMPKGWPEKGWD